MYNKDIIKETSAYILVVVGDSNDFASRYKLVGHYLSHCVFIIWERQVQVGHIAFIMLQKQTDSGNIHTDKVRVEAPGQLSLPSLQGR